MRRIAIAIIPLFTILLPAQYETRTTTTKTTWNGILVDADCQNTQVERQESSRQVNPDRSVTTRSERTHTERLDCPATTATSTFGLLTSDGSYIRFDGPSNARVIEFLNSHEQFSQPLVDRTPLRVSILGTATGDLAVIDSLNPQGQSSVTVTETSRVGSSWPGDIMFDVHQDGHRGKLVITANGVHFEDVSDADRSRSWSYADIEELRREADNEIEINAYSGDSFEFRIEGAGMTDAVYQAIEDRIVASRVR